ncbi:helix-turn-helix domain-containing protein [Chitinophaga tropicalis]|uniref:Helix-turn-helix domain-containing protein n=1 Tax=Chitinophaga tropicalis TaxID=2683588 RepID=A0A7K1UAL3_9BACT|nr:helix-turn-helix transcriptional regulator [Chitinophaga tropicalis]MVT11393.1 helix-turn-helix domain-containing protein [Chitinophaga tropicalis]
MLNNEHIIKQQIGARIKKLREDRGMSQSDLGYEANIDQNTVSRIELGKNNWRLETMIAIANALETNFFELFKPGKGH